MEYDEEDEIAESVTVKAVNSILSGKSVRKVISESISVNESAIPSGGDEINYFIFYCDNYTYDYNDIDSVAKFGRKHLKGLKDVSISEIKANHIYWGSDEASGFAGNYNGDTYVLFDDIDKLPADLKKDAYNHIDYYRKGAK